MANYIQIEVTTLRDLENPLTLEEVGAMVQAIARAWEYGSIPADEKKLATMFNLGPKSKKSFKNALRDFVEFEKLNETQKATIAKHFPKINIEEGRLFHPESLDILGKIKGSRVKGESKKDNRTAFMELTKQIEALKTKGAKVDGSITVESLSAILNDPSTNKPFWEVFNFIKKTSGKGKTNINLDNLVNKEALLRIHSEKVKPSFEE